MEWLRRGQGGGPSRLAEVIAELALVRHEAADYLSALSEWLRERHRGRGLAVTTETRAGMAARELVALAGRGDLLVMSSHGRTGPARWLLGSVAEEVVRQAPCPVLLVRAGA
ncbi:MAG: universal stress protein, partial [Chloroflexota bacterium]